MTPGDRPAPDPPGWYSDHAWATGPDAHTVTFPTTPTVGEDPR